MTRLIIIRHAESALNEQKRIQGHRDSNLTTLGLRQARRLAERLSTSRIDKVYSSDLGRAFSTTLEITRHRRLPIIRDPKLREIHLGDWEGMTPEEVDKLYNRGYEKWLKKPSSVNIPKSEGLRHFKKRVTERVKQIAKANRGKHVLIVTHGGAITALLADWLKADFDNLLINLRLDNTSITIAEMTDKRARLECINDASHLFSKRKNGPTLLPKHS